MLSFIILLLLKLGIARMAHNYVARSYAHNNMIDRGLFPGNYFDYDDDETARQREKEIVRDLRTAWVAPDATF